MYSISTRNLMVTNTRLYLFTLSLHAVLLDVSFFLDLHIKVFLSTKSVWKIKNNEFVKSFSLMQIKHFKIKIYIQTLKGSIRRFLLRDYFYINHSIFLVSIVRSLYFIYPESQHDGMKHKVCMARTLHFVCPESQCV